MSEMLINYYSGSKRGRPKVLVVEDDAIISYLLNFRLEREGFDVTLAADGQQACEYLETMTPPSLVLMDVMLPYLDGFELITRLRDKAEWDDVPVIMLTSKSHEQSIVRALDAGANDYVLKPFRPDELMARLRRLLR
jgi:DNA-binding response OmpR family regulator